MSEKNNRRRPPGDAVAVRPAESKDATQLALVHVGAWQAAYVGIMPQAYLNGLIVEEFADMWRRHLGEPLQGSRVLVALVETTVTGFASFGPAGDIATGRGGELYAVNVHPNHWGGGAGSALLSAAQAGLAELAFSDAALWVVTGNARARRFYERHGWRAEKDERTIQEAGATIPEIRYRRRVR